MRGIWPFIGFLVSIILAAGSPASGALADGSEEASYDADLRFVFDRDFAPFTYEEGGSLRGFELDLLRLLGEEVGFRLIPEPMVWTEAQRTFQRGVAEVIGGLVKTEERLAEFNFTARPHGTFDILTFVRDDGDVISADMLAGRKVAVQNGSISFDLLKDRNGIEVLAYESEGEALQALKGGEADAFVGGGSTTRFWMRLHDDSGIRPLATPWEMHSLYFGVRDPELLRSIDAAMVELLEDGRYDQLYRSWFVQELDDSEVSALAEASRKASLSAYAPYSRYPVGAAVLTSSGRIYTGCNVENALYGLTTSALKVAIYKAISEGDSEIRAVINRLPDGRAAAPTGEERQILFEFGRGILVVLGEEGNYSTKMVSEIFPYPFEMRD
ncbi:cytidine deaminase [Methanothrix harundinacea]|uniref:Extracellular solute-binding protein family 3 n=1 Tax=Methanothrix harundinacea (strain 6Ac) TaxID=1110509 RepID=G7WKW3_METH6|nr:cytidine deaminase [Methanothrix harundinacea]AET64146.1 Extracellular solute-binding protein family 3 [Methanothrix harundinacea 6Ac]